MMGSGQWAVDMYYHQHEHEHQYSVLAAAAPFLVFAIEILPQLI